MIALYLVKFDIRLQAALRKLLKNHFNGLRLES